MMYSLDDVKGNRGHTVICWNTHSLHPRLEEVERIIDRANPEIVAITESWLNGSTTNDMIAVDSYNIVRMDRTAKSGKHGGGGVMMYYKNSLKCHHLPELDFCDTYMECTWIKLSLTNVRPIYYGLVYRPPQGNVLSFLDKLESICLDLRSEGNCELNILGDMNLDTNKRRDARVKQYLDSIRRMGLSQIINNPTYEHHNGQFSAILDHFVTSDVALYQQHGVLNVSATDHLPIFASRKKEKEEHDKDKFYGRAYSRLIPEKFAEDVLTKNWDDVLNAQDPDIAWDLFKTRFVSILNKHAPYKYFFSRKDKKAWVTTEFLENTNERDNLSRLAKSRGCPVLRERHRRTRNRVVSLKREFKRHYFRTSIQEAKGDSAKLWKLLKKFIKNNSERDRILSIHGKDCPLDIANELNTYFADIGKNLASNIRPSGLELDFSPKPGIPSFALYSTTVEEVEKLLMDISDSKATGEDGIPIRFLKMTKELSARILCHIINRSIIENRVPLEWKYAIITPLFKEGDRTMANNYRPISILPAVSKILERTVHSQLYKHISDNNLLSPAQFGFRKNHSTSTCILALLDKIYKNMDGNKLTGVVFLDLKKAFDTVDHGILLKKLKIYNIDDSSILWFKNYLSDRYQSVKVQGKKSDKRLVSTGVPQGSILGPLLFILYLNDITDYIQECNVSLYADDTALYTSSNSCIDLMLTLRLELAMVSEWLAANKLTLNVAKTKYVIFGKNRQLTNLPNFNLRINGETLKGVPEMKYLGVTLDANLSFNKHIEIVHAKAVNKLGMLRRSRDFLDRKSALTLYQSLVLPQLSYCDTVYETTSAANKDKLQKVQNSALRCILKCSKRTSITSMHDELKILTLAQRRELNMAVECYKQATIDDSSLHHMFQKATRTRVTRHGNSNMMDIPRIASDLGRKAFSYRGPVFWNGMGNDLKSQSNKNTFKNAYLKKLLRDVNHPG